MNKKILIAIIGLVLISGLFLVFSSQSSDENEISENTNSVSKNTLTNQQDELETNKKSEAEENIESNSGLGYIEYSETALADSSGSNRVLFFHAPWCSVCNFYEGQIEEQGVPGDITILKIDYDSEDELKQRYNVTTQSTFVLLNEKGEIENSWPFARGLNGIQDLYSQI